MNYNNAEDHERKIKSSRDELNKMFVPEVIKEDESRKSKISPDNKVLVKERPSGNRANNEGGYGSVLGVILVIVAISFILTALFIRMMI